VRNIGDQCFKTIYRPCEGHVEAMWKLVAKEIKGICRAFPQKIITPVG